MPELEQPRGAPPPASTLRRDGDYRGAAVTVLSAGCAEAGCAEAGIAVAEE